MERIRRHYGRRVWILSDMAAQSRRGVVFRSRDLRVMEVEVEVELCVAATRWDGGDWTLS